MITMVFRPDLEARTHPYRAHCLRRRNWLDEATGRRVFPTDDINIYGKGLADPILDLDVEAPATFDGRRGSRNDCADARFASIVDLAVDLGQDGGIDFMA